MEVRKMRNSNATRLGNIGGAIVLLLAQLAHSDPYFRQMQPPRHPMPSEAALATEEIRGPLTPAIGPNSAAVTVVVFSDYHCPFCRTLSGTLEQLQTKYPEQVRVVYKHLATSDDTKVLSQAALCAAEQGRFAEYHHGIFFNRGVGPDRIGQLAADLGLDAAELSQCVESGRYIRRVEDDIREGERLGVQVTPTLFVNGRRIAGAASLETLSARVEKALR
jgi:protein-disulfide isomerase